jgi:two-component system alkaline phosphatase synthesis response regulator PhoP
MVQRLLLVEDDPRLIRALADLLRNEGYTLEVASDGKDALAAAKTQSFDLIILDVMLPSLSGLDVCRQLRLSNVNTPVLMLTARNQVNDKVLGFKSGADDYLTKPFDVDEFRVRVEALLRRSYRSGPIEPIEYRFGDVQVHFVQLKLVRSGHTFTLSEREGRLLRYLVENRGKIVSRDTLLERVWGYNTAPYTRTVDVHILRLRQKIEDDPRNPKVIVTVHGLGYRFDG